MLNGRSMLCEGLTARLGIANHPVVSVPLSSSIEQLAATLTHLRPRVLFLDAIEVRGSGFLFLDALRQEADLAGCPIVIVASGSFPDEERFRNAALQRDISVILDAVSFEELVAEVEALIAPPTIELTGVAD